MSKTSMPHIRRDRLSQDTKKMPDGMLFWVHTEDEGPRSLFILTPSTKAVPLHALAIKIKGRVYTSDYIPDSMQSDPATYKKAIDKAIGQLKIVEFSGWSPAFEQTDVFGEKEIVFRCAWCDAETPHPRGSCICRITHRALQRSK